MPYLSNNHYLRNQFLETNEVPTQTLIKNRMSPSLAAVYFKSMNKKLKVMVGLEPPMKGGGADWYVPPKDLLEGRAVLKPLKKEILSKLNYLGIDTIGMKILKMRFKEMQLDKMKKIQESDEKWKAFIEIECRQYFESSSLQIAKMNTERIQKAFTAFTTLYSTSISTIENVLFEAARSELVKIKDVAHKRMQEKYNTLIKQQATTLYDSYEDKMIEHKAKLKAEFMEKVEVNRTEMREKIHDLNVDKHTAVEKLRQYLECQTLACQVYVALKEREECRKKIEQSHYEHKKKVKTLTKDIASKDYEIIFQIQKENQRREFIAQWQKKVCHVVKKLQMFVSYCLSLLPDHAEFFIKLEKLMLLQLNETLENPTAETMFVIEEGQYEGPLPKPHPFYLFCDKGNEYKTQIKQDLCPKRCTSSASQMPVIIINKRCMYAACDNFEQFTNKIKSFIYGKRGDEADFMDYHVYEYDVPVKYPSSQQLLELKLENSLLQILQQEISNLKEVPVECGVCKTPHCFCTLSQVSQESINEHDIIMKPKHIMPVGNQLETRSEELLHERGPKWESYFKYIESKKCACMKTAKKHLAEHLPAYMRNMSVYDAPELPNYEPCSLTTLKNMVREARGIHPRTSPLISSKIRDMATQCSDHQFDLLCTCFSDDELQRLFEAQLTGAVLFDPLRTDMQFQLVDNTVSQSVLTKRASSFTTGRAHSLKNLIDNSPELQEIFRSTGQALEQSKIQTFS